MSECLPCDLEAAEAAAIIYRDENWSCEVADGYDVPGWFILRLRRHAEGWTGPTADELADFGPISQRLAAAIQAATGAVNVYFLSFGENYPHFHFLVIARDADLPAESRGAAILGLRAQGRNRAAALAVGDHVRDTLAGASL
jgi:diadenosine tetraphosphate (Ap4A) HIT family hydrolase